MKIRQFRVGVRPWLPSLPSVQNPSVSFRILFTEGNEVNEGPTLLRSTLQEETEGTENGIDLCSLRYLL